MDKKEKNDGKRSLLDIVKDILGRKDREVKIEEISGNLPGKEVVDRLIAKAAGDNKEDAEEKAPDPDPDEATGKKTSESQEEKRGCPYATKRAIVESLAAIKKFAEENELASTVVRALLTLLAEMALDALKGKVGIKALETLLKSLNYDNARKEAYREGEEAGRNARIREEIFPAQETELPDLNGSLRKSARVPNIFEIANEAGNI